MVGKVETSLLIAVIIKGFQGTGEPKLPVRETGSATMEDKKVIKAAVYCVPRTAGSIGVAPISTIGAVTLALTPALIS